jgi:phosphatidylglycerophosphatase A
VTGFVLFRIFDQLKPWPARAAERELPGGWGIMLDDLCAAAWAAAMVLLARWAGYL